MNVMFHGGIPFLCGLFGIFGSPIVVGSEKIPQQA